MAPDRLWDRAVSGGTVDPQVRVLRIFRQLAKWDRLEYLLRAIISSGAAKQFALSELEDWNTRFNRTFTTLTGAQHATLVTLLANARSQLSRERLSEIEFVLKRG